MLKTNKSLHTILERSTKLDLINIIAIWYILIWHCNIDNISKVFYIILDVHKTGFNKYNYNLIYTKYDIILLT